MVDSTITWVVLGAIAAAITIYMFLEKYTQRIIDYFRMRSFNRKFCDPLTLLRNETVEESYGIDPYHEFKDIKVEHGDSEKSEPIQREKFTAFVFSPRVYRDKNNFDLDAITILIEWGVKRPIRENLIKNGLEYDDADEIAIGDTKEIIEKTYGTLIKKRKSIEELKSNISQQENTSTKRKFIKKNYDELRNIVRKNYNKNLKEEYNKYLHSNKEYQQITKNDVNEIIRGIKSKKIIKDELDVRGGKNQTFTRTTMDRLKDIKHAFLTNRNSFVKRVNEIGNRSEEIYCLILENPGLYEMEMSDRFDIPQPTISIYCEEMSKNELVIKDKYCTVGNIVYLYPHFNKEDILKYHKQLSGYEVAIIAKLLGKDNNVYLEEFDSFVLDKSLINMSLTGLIGYKLFLKVRIDDSRLILTSYGIVESKSKQESLKKFFMF